MHTHHAVVFIDHSGAKILPVDTSDSAPEVLHPHVHVARHPTTTVEHEHPADLARFFAAVEKALTDVAEVLVVGHGSAKEELAKHMQAHAPALAKRIVGIETVDHPTDGELVAFARRSFHAKDRMRGTVP